MGTWFVAMSVVSGLWLHPASYDVASRRGGGGRGCSRTGR